MSEATANSIVTWTLIGMFVVWAGIGYYYLKQKDKL